MLKKDLKKTNSSKLIDKITQTSKNISESINKDSNKDLNQNILVLFDLDSTLFNTIYRSLAILQDFANNYRFNHKCEDLCNNIDQFFDQNPPDYKDIQEVYNLFDLIETHFYYPIDRKSQLAKVLMDFWKSRFFDGKWIVYDKLYKGAKNFIDQVSAIDHVTIGYLSARYHSKLYLASIKALCQHALPRPNKASIINNKKADKSRFFDPKSNFVLLKPSIFIDDLEFKKLRIGQLIKHYHRIFYFENDPQIVAMVIDQFPMVEPFLFDSVHSNRYKGKNIYQIATTFDSWSY